MICTDTDPPIEPPIEPAIEPVIEPIIAGKRGFAIIVTCDYKGSTQLKPLPATNKDASEMVQTIEELKYGRILLQNKDATESNIKKAIQKVSGDMGQLEDKILMFIFSGHGAKGDHIVTHDRKCLSLKEDIMKPLLSKRNVHDSEPNPPVLFIIDACRGSDRLTSGPDQSKSDDDDDVKGLIEQEANFRLDYATIDHHVSYAASEESRWLPVVAREIRNQRKHTFQNIMDIVQKKVWKLSPNKQQAQSLGQLLCGPLYLHPSHASDSVP